MSKKNREQAKKEQRRRKKSQQLLLKKIVVEIKKWREVLYLSQWRLKVEVDDLSDIERRDGTKYLAITDIIVPYREASMIFDINIPPDRIEETVIHELTHLLVHPVTDIVNTLLADRITSEEKNVLRDKEETSVSNIAHILKARIKVEEKKKKKKRKKKKTNKKKGGESDE